MLESMKNLQKGNLDAVNRDLIFPLVTWCSGYERNATICKILNRYVFYIDKELTLQMLALGIKPKPFIPYPKSKKDQNKKIEILQKYLIEEFNYGKSDISSLNKVFINILNSKEKLEEFSKRYGLENNERKILGLKSISFDKSLMKPKAGIDLFSF